MNCRTNKKKWRSCNSCKDKAVSCRRIGCSTSGVRLRKRVVSQNSSHIRLVARRLGMQTMALPVAAFKLTNLHLQNQARSVKGKRDLRVAKRIISNDSLLQSNQHKLYRRLLCWLDNLAQRSSFSHSSSLLQHPKKKMKN